jgi:hypothetical protein
MMSPQASACRIFIQDRLKISLVIMFIVSNRFPRREATQVHPSTWYPPLTNPARAIDVLMWAWWDYVPER